jgi:hypothetical protein
MICDQTGGASDSYQLTVLVKSRIQETPSILTEGAEVIDCPRRLPIDLIGNWERLPYDLFRGASGLGAMVRSMAIARLRVSDFLPTGPSQCAF